MFYNFTVFCFINNELNGINVFVSSETKHNMKLIKDLIDKEYSLETDLNKESDSKDTARKKTSKRKLIKRKIKKDFRNAKEFVPKIPSFKNIPKLKIKKLANNNIETSDTLLEENQTSVSKDEKCKEKAKNALSKLSPGKKALLQSIFMSRKKTTIKDLAKELKEPEDKLEELKANALRSLIYGKS